MEQYRSYQMERDGGGATAREVAGGGNFNGYAGYSGNAAYGSYDLARGYGHYNPRNYGLGGPSYTVGPRQWNPPQGHGVYLFIKFPGKDSEFAAQTVVLGQRTTHRGQFLGIARKVYDLSSDPKEREALVVYLFESTDAATRFFVSDGRFKQPDFPPPAGACEAWTVVKYLETRDDANYQTYMMCENTLKSATYHQYKDMIAQPFAELVQEYQGQPFVVQSVGLESLRRRHCENNTLVTVHLFRSEEDIKNMMANRRFTDLKRLQVKMATDTTSVFSIDNMACR